MTTTNLAMLIKQYLVDQAIIARNILDVSLPLRRLRKKSAHLQPVSGEKRFLILPSDPVAPSGSMGEMAMLSGLTQTLRTQHPDAKFTLVGTRSHEITLPGVGEVEVVPAWTGRDGSLAFDQLIRQHHALFGLGADVLDGKYGAALVCRFVSYCNHAVRLGIPATIIGFSFNSTPRRPAVHSLSRLHPDVRVNVRGQPSLRRFTKSVGTAATLCADVAFLMAPSLETEAETEGWLNEMRIAGRIPVGVNMSAHAFSQVISIIGADALAARMAQELSKAAEHDSLAYLLMPHDVKSQSGDITLLRALEKSLNALGMGHVRYVLQTDPARIKRVAGLLDLVITGRMHLAIAALGMKTPILSITYQDKFEELYQVFNLPQEDIVQSQHCVTNALSEHISRAIARRSTTAALITKNMPSVQRLAEQNLVLGEQSQLFHPHARKS